jgi:hypothetical protein
MQYYAGGNVPAAIVGKRAAAEAAAALPVGMARPLAGLVTHWIWKLPYSMLAGDVT